MPLQVVVMGVSGTGKSTVAAAVADRLGWGFVEGDDLHPAGNVAKMASGEPLTDDDRAPWLELIRARARQEQVAGRSSVITCSALRRRYRERLRDGVEPMFFLHLRADEEVLGRRMTEREGHFMPSGLLRSQLETLEPLEGDEDGVAIDVSRPVGDVVSDAHRAVRVRLAG